MVAAFEVLKVSWDEGVCFENIRRRSTVMYLFVAMCDNDLGPSIKDSDRASE